MKTPKIKIISGFTQAGGSTVANINLCNLFNEKGLDCTFHGPQEWHLDKCNGALLNPDDAAVNEDGEILLLHYLKFPSRPPESKKVILTCHEKALFPITSMKKFWDEVHFVSEHQKNWHNEPGFVIPNVVTPLEKNKKESKGVAAVIGSIDKNKRTHVAIRQALEEGYKEIRLYGFITDEPYFNSRVKPYADEGIITMMGHEDDKQKMYDSTNKVFHASRSETFNFIIPECERTGTEYWGEESANPFVDKQNLLGPPYEMTNDEIFEAWMENLEIS